MKSSRQFIRWLPHQRLDKNGRLFPMVERGLDPSILQTVRRAMEEKRQESSARVVEGETIPGRAPFVKNKAPRWCVTEGLGGKKRRNPVPHRPASRSPGGKVISTRPMLQRDWSYLHAEGGLVSNRISL